MEQFLGIRFKYKPKKAPWDDHNLHALRHLNRGQGKDFRPDFEPDASATYYPRFNTFFYDPAEIEQGSIFTKWLMWHENFHGYFVQNTGPVRKPAKYLKNALLYMYDKLPNPAKFIRESEAYEITEAFEEGICDFAGVETYYRSEGITDRFELFNEHRKAIFPSYNEDAEGFSAYIAELEEEAGRTLRLPRWKDTAKLLHEEKITPEEFDQWEDFSLLAYYPYFHNFTNTIMLHLDDGRLPLPDLIDMVINTPPRSMDETINPTLYYQRFSANQQAYRKAA